MSTATAGSLQEHEVAHHFGIGDDRLRVYLYHIPPVSAVPITHKLVERLMKAYPRQIAGMKDSSDDWPHTKSMIEAFGKDGFDVFSGNEKPIVENVKAGGAGSEGSCGKYAPGPRCAVGDSGSAMRCPMVKAGPSRTGSGL